jgi:hypothetical protein
VGIGLGLGWVGEISWRVGLRIVDIGRKGLIRGKLESFSIVSKT